MFSVLHSLVALYSSDFVNIKSGKRYNVESQSLNVVLLILKVNYIKNIYINKYIVNAKRGPRLSDKISLPV